MVKRKLSISEMRDNIEYVLKNKEDFKKDSDTSAFELLEQLNIYQQELEFQNDELKRLQDELEKSRDHFQNLFEKAPVGYVVYSDDMNIRSMNKTMQQMLQLKEKSPIMKITDVIHPDFQDYFYFHVKNVLSKEKEYSLESKIISGERTLFVKIVSNIFTNNGEKLIRTAFIDLKEQKRVEAHLRSTMEKFTIAFQTSPDVMTITTLNGGRYIEVNKRFEEITGYRQDEVVNKTVNDINIWVDESFRNRFVTELKEKGRVSGMEGRFRRKNGDIGFTRMGAEVIKLDGEECLLAVFEDITKTKQAAEKIKHLNVVLSSIRRVNQLIMREKDISVLAGQVCEILTGMRGYETAWIIQIDEDKHVRNVAISGVELSDEQKNKINDDLIDHCAKKALASNELVIVDKNNEYCKDCPLEGITKYHKGFLKRLDYEGKTYGVMAVSVPERLSTDTEEQDLFTELADDIAFAIDGIYKEKNKIRAEKALAKSEQSYSTLFRHATVGVFRTSSKGEFLLANPEMARIAGAKDEYELREAYPDIKTTFYVDPKKRDEFLAEIQKNGSVENFEYAAKRIDGAHIWLRMNAAVSETFDDGSFTIDGFITDVTRHVEAVKSRLEAERRLKLATDSAGIGVWDYNLKTKELIWDEWMFKLYGIQSESFSSVYEAWKNSLHPEDREQAHKEVEMAVSGERVFDTDYRILQPGGVVKYLKASAIVIKDAQGQPERMIGVNYDISERKQNEKLLREQNREYESINEELRQTNEELLRAKDKAEEADRLKSAFLANMSHEIRTPLNGIMGFSDLLTLPDISQDKKMMYYSVIKQNGQRLMSLINDLIDISKIEAGQVDLNLGQVNLNHLLAELEIVFQQQNENQDVDVRCEYGSNVDNLSLFTDPNRLSQVITNLVRNSMKFTRKGAISFGYKVEGNEVIFYVSDTGVGISSDIKDFIFKRFRQGAITLTRPYEGSGLGLSISKGIIELLGGKIWFESEEDNGTIFHFSHPLKAKLNATNDVIPAYEKASEKNEVTAESLAGKTVLVVEDDQSSLMLVEQILIDAGMKVLSATNGRDSVEICRKENPDIVLMDVKLPIMDGFKATAEIKSFKPELPVIAQTAFAMSGDRSKALNAGCDDYVSKPINKETLLKTMKRLL